jgi:DNA-binding response OmpR family regulator
MDKIKILIVEDDEAIVALYDVTLNKTIFEIKIARDGEEGLKLYADWKPDIILLDIMLPVKTGYGVLQKIRKELKDTDTVIIMATSLGKKEDIVDCMKYGIQGYLVKPFDRRNIIVDVLGGYGKLHPKRAALAATAYKEYIKTSNNDGAEKTDGEEKADK